ncbi:MAG: serine--tRNA ligase, partial [Clostridia bacterium]|nr:serine--tRNA ligase [Clostridia bacterium]
MLDINLIRQNPEYVKERLAAKGCHADIDGLLKMDVEKRAFMTKVEEKKAEQNKVSKQIPALKKQGQDVSGIMNEMKALSEEIRQLDSELAVMTAKIKEFMDALPNLPADDVVPGGKEANAVVSVYGEKPVFDFEAKDHVELATSLNLVDYPRGAKLGGNGFWIYKGLGAQLEWALINFFIECHLADGYEFMLPPHILTYQCGYTAGQFPKFEEDVFSLTEGAEGDKFNFFMLPKEMLSSV